MNEKKEANENRENPANMNPEKKPKYYFDEEETDVALFDEEAEKPEEHADERAAETERQSEEEEKEDEKANKKKKCKENGKSIKNKENEEDIITLELTND